MNVRGKRSSGRDSDPRPLKAAIEDFLERYHLENKMAETRLLAAWEKVVGQMIARHTSDLRVRNRVLFVRVSSAAIRSELHYARKRILASLNREAGGNIIDEIVLN